MIRGTKSGWNQITVMYPRSQGSQYFLISLLVTCSVLFSCFRYVDLCSILCSVCKEDTLRSVFQKNFIIWRLDYLKKKKKKKMPSWGKKKKNKLSVPQDLADVALECFIEKIISTRC